MAIKISGSTIIDDSRNIVNAGVVTASSFDGNITGIAITLQNGILLRTEVLIIDLPDQDFGTENDPAIYLVRGQEYKFTIIWVRPIPD